MGVPAHDIRDFEFAKKYNLEIIQSIAVNNKVPDLDKPRK
jgi:leucyl-tRNA synthetase